MGIESGSYMPNLIELAIPGFVLLMTIEAIADAVLRRDLYEIKDSAASITMGLGNVAVNLVAKAHAARDLQRDLSFPDFLPGLSMVGVGASVFLRRVQLLLVPSREPRVPVVLGVARGASLVAAIQPVDGPAPELDGNILSAGSSGRGSLWWASGRSWC